MRIVLLGHGVMGRAVEAVALDAGHEVVLRVDAGGPPLAASGIRGRGAGAEDAVADVAIEFAGPAGAANRVREAIEVGLPVVSGSTGWDGELAATKTFVRKRGGALLHAPNLSIGVAVFERIVRRAARLLDAVPDYRIELEETHHTRKLDHPSGTARWLADGLVEGIGRLDVWRGELTADDEASGGRAGRDGARADGTLTVRSFRRGDVAGTHVVRAVGPDDVIELEHRALGRDGFARGALRAAEWLHERSGVYTLEDMLDDLLGSPDLQAS